MGLGSRKATVCRCPLRCRARGHLLQPPADRLVDKSAGLFRCLPSKAGGEERCGDQHCGGVGQGGDRRRLFSSISGAASPKWRPICSITLWVSSRYGPSRAPRLTPNQLESDVP